jgi:hypothetical protein
LDFLSWNVFGPSSSSSSESDIRCKCVLDCHHTTSRKGESNSIEKVWLGYQCHTLMYPAPACRRLHGRFQMFESDERQYSFFFIIGAIRYLFILLAFG